MSHEAALLQAMSRADGERDVIERHRVLLDVYRHEQRNHGNLGYILLLLDVRNKAIRASVEHRRAGKMVIADKALSFSCATEQQMLHYISVHGLISKVPRVDVAFFVLERAFEKERMALELALQHLLSQSGA